MNEQNEPNENAEPSEADEVVDLPEIVEATAGDEVPADAAAEATPAE